MLVIGQDQNICGNGSYGHDVCPTVKDENYACVCMVVCESEEGEIMVKDTVRLGLLCVKM